MGAEAAFSRCRRYRWWLRRRWRETGPTLLFLGLNPSSANGRQDDPTLRRLIRFAEGWGYGALEVLNLFAWISTDPANLRFATEPVGRSNDAWIRRRVRQLQQCDAAAITPPMLSGTQKDRGDEQAEVSRKPDATLPLWLGWGNGGRWLGRDERVLLLLNRLPVRLLCLSQTASGRPRHPLYAKGGSPLRPFAPSWRTAPAASAAPCPAPRAATRST